MRLVIGGAYQGKKEYVKRHYNIEESEIWCGDYPVGAGGWKCIYGLHNIIKNIMQELSTGSESIVCMNDNTAEQRKKQRAESTEWPVEGQTQHVLRYISRLTDNYPDIILICDEVGGGIVPIEKTERDYRECVGRVLCELAKDADTVERVNCGIGRMIKRTVSVTLLRHGATEGNLAKRYIGVTEEPLCETGIADLERKKKNGVFPNVGRLIVSPMRRCLQTAEIVYPDVAAEVVEAFRETDFGLFEGKNYEELMADEALRDKYQTWIDSGGRLPFPEGESVEQAAARCAEAFEKILPTLTEDTVFIVHGGTIMSILSAYATPKKDYHDYQCGNGEGYLCRVELTGDGQLYRMMAHSPIIRKE